MLRLRGGFYYIFIIKLKVSCKSDRFRWKSYSKSQETVLFKSVQQSIHALFDRTENQHGMVDRKNFRRVLPLNVYV